MIETLEHWNHAVFLLLGLLFQIALCLIVSGSAIAALVMVWRLIQDEFLRRGK